MTTFLGSITPKRQAQHVSRRAFCGAVAALGTALTVAGCSPAGNGASKTADSSPSEQEKSLKVTVGTLATEDLLPLWVAQSEGFDAAEGAALEIVPFQSATELIAGVSSGDVDMAMTDIMVSASLFASGTDLSLQWVTLGATADQGRFGIMSAPGSGIESMSDLAGVPIGVGSNTILEYVMDRLMATAGIPADKVITEELQKLPVRYQAMASGEVKAAALPGSLLALGESQGMRTIADDTSGENISQSVMIARRSFLESSTGSEAVAAVRRAWNKGAQAVNADPEEYRSVLLANANLPEAVADTYKISTYPEAERPTAAMVEPVLEWMSVKGYLNAPLSYNSETGSFSA